MENTMEKRIPVIIPAYEPDEKMIRLLQTGIWNRENRRGG